VVAALSNIFLDEKLIPKALQFDNGGEFRNGEMKTFCLNKGIQLIYGRSYTPTDNGLCENFNGTWYRYFSAYLDTHGNENTVANLPSIAQVIVANYNLKTHTTTGYAPIQLYYFASEDMLNAAAQR
jgi:transposase InsO family protein